MTATIIAIGDELLFGQTLDTNSHWIAGQLDELGIHLSRILIVKDKPDAIKDALELSSKESELILLTGGLGPTKDDITKSTLAEFFGVELKFNEAAFSIVERFFRHSGAGDTHQAQRHRRGGVEGHDHGRDGARR